MRTFRAIAEYYDLENAHHAMLQRDIPFFLHHVPAKKQTILDLGVGTGRSGIPIAQAGHYVVGVDYAREMLSIARRKRAAAGLTANELELIHADITRMDLGTRFDWVTIFFNTFLGFTTIPEQDSVLQTVCRHLKPQGRFWIDIVQPNLELMAEEAAGNLDSCVFFVPRYNRTVYKTTTVKRKDPTNQTQRVTFHYTSFDSDGQEHNQKTHFDLTFIFPRELKLLLDRNGLKMEKLYGDYDGSKLQPHSPRIIACCTLKNP